MAKVAKTASKNAPTNRGQAKKFMHNGKEVVMIYHVGADNKSVHAVAYKEQVISGKGGDIFVRKADGSLLLWRELMLGA